jgi:hypothetical protein
VVAGQPFCTLELLWWSIERETGGSGHGVLEPDVAHLPAEFSTSFTVQWVHF